MSSSFFFFLADRSAPHDLVHVEVDPLRVRHTTADEAAVLIPVGLHGRRNWVGTVATPWAAAEHGVLREVQRWQAPDLRTGRKNSCC
jgi:hypothetical protein